MYSRRILAFTVAAAALLAGCILPADNSRGDVSASDAKGLVEARAGDGGFVVLDVRTPQEFESGHLGGAVNVDYYSGDFRERIGGMDRSKTYLIYCRTGVRGAEAAGLMGDMGFNATHNVRGGIESWKAAGFQVVNS
jgi:rhodanese-related sulfurtransferase